MRVLDWLKSLIVGLIFLVGVIAVAAALIFLFEHIIIPNIVTVTISLFFIAILLFAWWIGDDIRKEIALSKLEKELEDNKAKWAKNKATIDELQKEIEKVVDRT